MALHVNKYVFVSQGRGKVKYKDCNYFHEMDGHAENGDRNRLKLSSCI